MKNRARAEFEVPVVLFVYRRPAHTQKVFEALSRCRPARLYVFANGPQDPSEEALCIETQRIFDAIDWECELITDFLPRNIGLSPRIISGLNRVFETETQAIILEDDCVPSPAFFEFSRNLLQHYAHDEQVMHLNGTNIIQDHPLLQDYPHSYFFVPHSLPSWGWATWRRAWQKFNLQQDTWERYKKQLFIKFKQPHFQQWTAVFRFHRDVYPLWDVQWCLDIWRNQGLVVVPRSNLVSNIGYDENATFTRAEASKYANLQVAVAAENKPLIHPPFKMYWEKSSLYEDELIHFLKECRPCFTA